MLKNITLSAEEALIEQARQRAESEGTTLNAKFRQWLTQYAQRPRSRAEFRALMARMNYALPGKTFSREELNER